MKSEGNNIIDLVQKCKENDRISQKIIYEQFYGKMMGVALRYFKNRDLASDIVQESFIKVFNKIEQFKGGENLEGWIKRVVRNNCIDQLRKNKNIYFTSEEVLKNIADEKTENSPLYEHLTISDVVFGITVLFTTTV